jgi:hypothetical protein
MPAGTDAAGDAPGEPFAAEAAGCDEPPPDAAAPFDAAAAEAVDAAGLEADEPAAAGDATAVDDAAAAGEAARSPVHAWVATSATARSSVAGRGSSCLGDEVSP